MQHQHPADELVREPHGLHDLHKIIKHYSIIGFEHVKAGNISRNIVSMNIIKRAGDIGDAKQNILLLN